MKIVAVSDMHGDLKNVHRIIDNVRPDMMLCCGDWGDPGEFDPQEFTSVLARTFVLSVYGNHDDIDLLKEARNIDGSPVLLTPEEVREIGGILFAGISGIWAKSHREVYYVTNDNVARYAESLAGKGVDILLTHGCAIGLVDALPSGGHGGQRCFLDAFHRIAPRLYLCGHLHVAQKRVLKDGRIVINIGETCKGDYWVLDIDRENTAFEHFVLR